MVVSEGKEVATMDDGGLVETAGDSETGSWGRWRGS